MVKFSMFNAKSYQALPFLVAIVCYCSSEHLIPFHLKFYGTQSQGLGMVFSQRSITFVRAVNLCSELCKEHWWCFALRKCADRPNTFQCHVVCPMNNLGIESYGKGDKKCFSLQVSISYSKM
jgi:hypothetical protein